MASKSYNRGSAFERRIKRELEGLGYYVIKSGGSKGPADLVAINKFGKPYLIQCKKDGKLSKDEWNKLVDTGFAYNSSTLHVCKPKRNEPIQFEYLHMVGELLNLGDLDWVETE